MKQVTILYKSLPAYRLEFFNKLRTRLAADDVALTLIYGDPTGVERFKKDQASLSWAVHRPNRTTRLGGRQLIWQPVLSECKQSDLVIVEQASKLLVNYVLLLRQVASQRPRVGLWGHGANLQRHNASRISEFAKRRYSRLPHWWFAYTEGSKQRVEHLGYPEERITVVQNSIDTVGLVDDIQAIPEEALAQFMNDVDAKPGAVGLFLGSLYSDKRLDFLIESAICLRNLMPNFVLLVAGDGPDRDVIEAAARNHAFIKPLGRVDGYARALALKASDVILMPGLVGLAILDSFASESPMVTTDVDFHSPEIEYLASHENGLILPRESTPGLYAHAVKDLLTDQVRLRDMRAACRVAARRYTTDEMVQRFSAGVHAALQAETQ